MPRRSWKTINIPREFVEWLDAFLAPGKTDPTKAPLGITSRDEYFRLAGGILAAALIDTKAGTIPLEEIQRILDRLRDER